ncbi:hypothetical protein [Shimia sp. Alg240-R146]|uniref:hypothetical protein n=1 Tax=Shimia sp. Alg240-R146 TaxID=2993449 RepID=UPI0022E83667|nr:hypothetical protein [Shimia sp. Alg240-R146]
MIPRLLPDSWHAFLVRRLGRAKADRLYVFYYRFAGLILFGGLFSTGALAFVMLYDPPQMTAQNHLRVPVAFTHSKSSDSAALRVFATVTLPDGAKRTVSTTRMSVAAGTLDEICLLRLTSEARKEKFRWVSMSNCEASH